VITVVAAPVIGLSAESRIGVQRQR